MLARASLHQRDGETAAARQLLEKADAIFSALGTRDEPTKVKKALDALQRGAQIPLLAGEL